MARTPYYIKDGAAYIWPVCCVQHLIDDTTGLQVIAERTSNRVTSITSSSTNDQYPTAKAVYDLIGGAIGGTY